MEKPEAIMINVPQKFFDEYPGGKAEYLNVMLNYVDPGKCCWYNCISKIPRNEILWCYLVFDGKVQLRANIMEYIKNANLTFYDGGIKRTLGTRNWCVLTGPVIKAPYDILQRGFRGFRYTNKLF